MTDLNTIPCTLHGCDKAFTTQSHMMRHYRTIHQKQKNYICPILGCFSSFGRKDNMDSHFKNHCIKLEGGKIKYKPNALVPGEELTTTTGFKDVRDHGHSVLQSRAEPFPKKNLMNINVTVSGQQAGFYDVPVSPIVTGNLFLGIKSVSRTESQNDTKDHGSSVSDIPSSGNHDFRSSPGDARHLEEPSDSSGVTQSNIASSNVDGDEFSVQRAIPDMIGDGLLKDLSKSKLPGEQYEGFWKKPNISNGLHQDVNPLPLHREVPNSYGSSYKQTTNQQLCIAPHQQRHSESNTPPSLAGPPRQIKPVIALQPRKPRPKTEESDSDPENLANKKRCTYPGCPQKFTTKGHMVRHFKSIHTEVKPFKCPIIECLATFGRRDNMVTHYRSHVAKAQFRTIIHKPGAWIPPMNKDDTKPNYKRERPAVGILPRSVDPSRRNTINGLHAFEIAMNLKEGDLDKPLPRESYAHIKPKVDAGLLYAVNNQLQALVEPPVVQSNSQKRKRRLGLSIVNHEYSNSCYDGRDSLATYKEPPKSYYDEDRERRDLSTSYQEGSTSYERSHSIELQMPAYSDPSKSHFERFEKHSRLLESLTNPPKPNEDGDDRSFLKF